jgi:hypothetical protein
MSVRPPRDLVCVTVINWPSAALKGVYARLAFNMDPEARPALPAVLCSEVIELSRDGSAELRAESQKVLS